MSENPGRPSRVIPWAKACIAFLVAVTVFGLAVGALAWVLRMTLPTRNASSVMHAPFTRAPDEAPSRR